MLEHFYFEIANNLNGIITYKKVTKCSEPINESATPKWQLNRPNTELKC